MKKHNPNTFRKQILTLYFGLLLTIFLLAAMLDILAGISLYPWDVVLVIASTVVFLVAYFLYWRCPFCEKALPRSEGNLEFCPHCGQPLPKFDGGER